MSVFFREVLSLLGLLRGKRSSPVSDMPWPTLVTLMEMGLMVSDLFTACKEQKIKQKKLHYNLGIFRCRINNNFH